MTTIHFPSTKRLTEYRKYPYIDIYFHDENSGFGYGHNHNLIASDSRYGIICNPDILVDEETVTALVLLLKEHPECAMLAPKILNEDGTTQHLIREQLAVLITFCALCLSNGSKSLTNDWLCLNAEDCLLMLIVMYG